MGAICPLPCRAYDLPPRLFWASACSGPGRAGLSHGRDSLEPCSDLEHGGRRVQPLPEPVTTSRAHRRLGRVNMPWRVRVELGLEQGPPRPRAPRPLPFTTSSAYPQRWQKERRNEGQPLLTTPASHRPRQPRTRPRQATETGGNSRQKQVGDWGWAGEVEPPWGGRKGGSN